MAAKPPNSDAGKEQYVYDFVGMLGLPLVPTAKIDTDARAAFFPVHSLKDPQFKSSFKFVVLMLAFPIFYILQTVVFALFCKLSWGSWIYLLSLPISAVLAWWWNSGFKHLKNQWKFLSFAKKSNPGFVKMMEEYHLIIGKVDEVVS